MKEIYVAHEVVFNKVFNRYAFYHSELLGCHFDSQYIVSKEVVLLTIDKDKGFCYLDSKEPCKVIDSENLQKSIILFNCCYCSKYISNGKDCENIANIPSEVMGVVNVMPISEFTKIGDVPLAISLVNEYNDSVKGEFEPISNKNYTDIMIEINSGFSRVRNRKEN